MTVRRTLGLAAVLLGVVAGWIWWALLRPCPRPGELTHDVAPGASMVEVLDSLHHAEILPSPTAGRLYVAIFARGRSFRFGHYRIPTGSRPVDVLEQILAGRVETREVTVVEGSRADEIVDTLVAAGFGGVQEWQALVHDRTRITDLAPEATSLEGFLFPDTYRFAIGLSADATARHMVKRFTDVWTQERRSAGEPWGSVLEVVTLASLVEAETSVPEERARIAGVFFNRLRRGMLLQCDPTVVYALHRRGEWQGRLLRVHWEVDDPYNTYRHAGLPPGPINCPGRASLHAALAPEEHDYLYFVARPGGGHTFSTNLRDHNRAVAQLRNSRR